MISIEAPDGVPEVRPGDDLASHLLSVSTLEDGDIVAVTSKVVSKAEGRQVTGERDRWIDQETTRLVAHRGRTRIVRNRIGLTMAAAGVDNSNVAAGAVLLLPIDPDATARRLRSDVGDRTGRNIGVIVTDTAGRAWRQGQTDIAIGAAGLRTLESYAGRVDAHGNDLVVTAPAVADELAGAAELVQGKLGDRPFALIRGRADLVLPPGQDGPGAQELIRDEGSDLFGYGAREAVLRAAARVPADVVPFGAAVSVNELADVLARAEITVTSDGDSLLVEPSSEARCEAALAIAYAHGWQSEPTKKRAAIRLRPVST